VPFAARARSCWAPRREIVAAPVLASVRVDPRFKPQSVNVVGNGFHNAGPLARIDGDVTRSIASSLPPAFVDIHVFVSRCLEAARDHRVCLRLDHRVVDLGGEGVPRSPAHRRSRVRHSGSACSGSVAQSCAARAGRARCSAVSAEIAAALHPAVSSSPTLSSSPTGAGSLACRAVRATTALTHSRACATESAPARATGSAART
jgi:hypothetical protein